MPQAPQRRDRSTAAPGTECPEHRQHHRRALAETRRRRSPGRIRRPRCVRHRLSAYGESSEPGSHRQRGQQVHRATVGRCCRGVAQVSGRRTARRFWQRGTGSAWLWPGAEQQRRIQVYRPALVAPQPICVTTTPAASSISSSCHRIARMAWPKCAAPEQPGAQARQRGPGDRSPSGRSSRPAPHTRRTIAAGEGLAAPRGLAASRASWSGVRAAGSSVQRVAAARPARKRC